jgi:hypothetical protein
MCDDFSRGGSFGGADGPERETLRLGFNSMGDWNLGYTIVRIREWCG